MEASKHDKMSAVAGAARVVAAQCVARDGALMPRQGVRGDRRASELQGRVTRTCACASACFDAATGFCAACMRTAQRREVVVRADSIVTAMAMLCSVALSNRTQEVQATHFDDSDSLRAL